MINIMNEKGQKYRLIEYRCNEYAIKKSPKQLLFEALMTTLSVLLSTTPFNYTEHKSIQRKKTKKQYFITTDIKRDASYFWHTNSYLIEVLAARELNSLSSKNLR